MNNKLHLDGIKVLDLSRLLPGPLCSLLLADLGADVLKVEDPRGGDYARYFPPLVDDQSAFYSAVNRNKRSLTLNLKADGAADILRELVASADVLLESFRPGVLDRLGVGWDTLRDVNPQLVYCAITGYGQTGPYRDRAGHDVGYVAKTGMLQLNGRPGEPVHLAPFQIADIAGGSLQAAFGICAALLGRERTGEGSFLDVSMTEGALMFAMPSIAASRAGEVQSRGGNMLTGAIPSYNIYETADERFLAVGALEPKFWAGFTQAIGRPDLMAEGASTGGEGEEAKAEVAAVIASKTLAEWTEVFSEVDVCVEPVQTFEETLEDAQHAARRMFFTLGGVQHVRSPLAPGNREHTPAPGLGEHTEEVLRSIGKSEAEITDLREAGAI